MSHKDAPPGDGKSIILWYRVSDLASAEFFQVGALQRRPGLLDRSPGKLPFVEQMQKKRPNMLGTELIRGLVEVGCELGNGVGVVANRALGEVP